MNVYCDVKAYIEDENGEIIAGDFVNHFEIEDVPEWLEAVQIRAENTVLRLAEQIAYLRGRSVEV